MKTMTKTITIKEEFMPVDTKVLDSKNSIHLGEKLKKLLFGKLKVDAFQVFIGKGGDLLLRPAANIPSREAWLFQNPSALEKVKSGLKDVAQGKIKHVSDLDLFLAGLRRFV